jgi:hypothetical protein
MKLNCAKACDRRRCDLVRSKIETASSSPSISSGKGQEFTTEQSHSILSNRAPSAPSCRPPTNKTDNRTLVEVKK